MCDFWGIFWKRCAQNDASLSAYASSRLKNVIFVRHLSWYSIWYAICGVQRRDASRRCLHVMEWLPIRSRRHQKRTFWYLRAHNSRVTHPIYDFSTESAQIFYFLSVKCRIIARGEELKKRFCQNAWWKWIKKWPKPCRCVILTETHFQNQKSILIKLSTQNVQNIVTDYSCARILFKTTSAATILKKISKNWKTWTTKTQKNGAKIDIPSSSRYSFAWFFRQWW